MTEILTLIFVGAVFVTAAAALVPRDLPFVRRYLGEI